LKGQVNRSVADGKERTTSVTQRQRGGAIVTDEVLFQRGTTMMRRLRLAPGEAMRWHRDPFQRVAVVVRGDLLSIEYRDGGGSQRVEITPGQVEWGEPSTRLHRAVNVGKQTYEQVTVFLLDRSDAVAQPSDE
jgi:quercetin dioxygenase-like cupin family protein